MITGNIKRIIAAAVLLTFSYAAFAQQAHNMSAKIYFHRAMYNIDLGYEHNGSTLSNFIYEFNDIYGSDPSSFSYILIRTGCSPEGGIEYNRQLAFNRAKSIRDYLVDHLGINPTQVRIDPVGIDWSGLREEMAKQYFPGRWDMFALMDRYGVISSTERGDEATCQIQMMRDRGGEPWRWMSQNIFPKLRAGNGQISVVVDDSDASPKKKVVMSEGARDSAHAKDTLVIIHRDTVYFVPYFIGQNGEPGYGCCRPYGGQGPTAGAVAAAPYQSPVPVANKHAQRDSLLKVPVMAFRSNLLLPAMNLGIEVPLGNRWSIAADWYYPWVWRPWMNSVYPAQENCAQLLGGYVEARYWFGNRHTSTQYNRRYRLSGHSLALTGAGGYYDYGHIWTGTQGEFGMIGLDYMYSLILGKGNVHMDFDIGLGYFQRQKRNYEVYEEGGKLYGDLQRFNFNSVIPIKAGVSLVVPVFKSEKQTVEDE